MIRTPVIKLTISLVFLLATACQASPPTATLVIDDPQAEITEISISPSPTAAQSIVPAMPVEPAAPTQVTQAPTSTLPPTLQSPLPLNPATIARLEQVGLVEYSPWDLVLAATWAPDGELLAVAAGERIYLYSSNLEEQGRLEVGDWTTSLSFHPLGFWLAAGGRDGLTRIWDVHTQSLVQTLDAHKKGVNAVAFNPDGGNLATAGNDAVARLWDPMTGERLAQMIGGTYAIPSIAFSRDGADLAITNGGLIRIRDVETSRFVHTLQNQDTNYSIARSPNGNLVAAGSTTGHVYLWDLTTGAMPDPLLLPSQPGEGQASLVWSIAFSPDGSLLAASDNDGRIRFWDVTGSDFLSSRAVISQGITCLAFSPNGQYLVSGGLDGVLRLWAAR